MPRITTGWILNTTPLHNRRVPKLFTPDELGVLFNYSVLAHVLEGGGTIFVIGDLTTAFYTPPSTGRRGWKGQTALLPERFDPFVRLFQVERDSQAIDYRRVSRPFNYDHPDIYAYLDQVSSWDYSLKFQESSETFTPLKLGATNFGTCLAAQFSVGSGHLILLPSLGTTVEEEEKYLFQHFVGIDVRASAPAWVKDVVIPGEESVQVALNEKCQSLEVLRAELKWQEEDLRNLQRWKRLLWTELG